MDISTPNENGCLAVGATEVVASLGRSQAVVEIALCDDGRYRFTIGLSYSYGGFGGPIRAEYVDVSSLAEARTAGMEQLLQCWPKAFNVEPQSVHAELRELRRQIESQLRQPSLF